MWHEYTGVYNLTYDYKWHGYTVTQEYSTLVQHYHKDLTTGVVYLTYDCKQNGHTGIYNIGLTLPKDLTYSIQLIL